MSYPKILLFLGLGFASLFAAEPEIKRVTLSLYYLAEIQAPAEGQVRELPPTLFMYPVGKKTATVGFTPNVRTPTFVYEGPAPLLFFKEELRNNELVRVPLATVSIPSDWNRALLLVAPSPPGAATPYQLLPIRDDREGLPLNHAKVVNLGKQELLVQANGAVSSLAPGGNWVIDYANAQNIGLSIKLAATMDDRPRIVASTLVSARAGTRKTLIAYPQGAAWSILEFADMGDKTPSPPQNANP